MEYDNMYHPNESENFDDSSINGINLREKELDSLKKYDRGYNKISILKPSFDGRLKNTKVELYTSGDIGSNIRDAETGAYYSNKVGSYDEELFFKVTLATGQCKSLNNSNKLFYLSPEHYSSHLNVDLSSSVINRWENKRQKRLHEMDNKKIKQQNKSTLVN